MMDLHSYDVITLKQASEINKKYKEHESVFQKIINGEYDAIQNLSFDVVRFAFSNYYNDKPYLSDMMQALQYCILKSGVLCLNLIDFSFAAKCLNNSLHKYPEDMTIIDQKIIDKIQRDTAFKECLNNIIMGMTKTEKNKILIVVLYFLPFLIFDLVSEIIMFDGDLSQMIGGNYNLFKILAKSKLVIELILIHEGFKTTLETAIKNHFLIFL